MIIEYIPTIATVFVCVLAILTIVGTAYLTRKVKDEEEAGRIDRICNSVNSIITVFVTLSLGWLWELDKSRRAESELTIKRIESVRQIVPMLLKDKNSQEFGILILNEFDSKLSKNVINVALKRSTKETEGIVIAAKKLNIEVEVPVKNNAVESPQVTNPPATGAVNKAERARIVAELTTQIEQKLRANQKFRNELVQERLPLIRATVEQELKEKTDRYNELVETYETMLGKIKTKDWSAIKSYAASYIEHDPSKAIPHVVMVAALLSNEEYSAARRHIEYAMRQDLLTDDADLKVLLAYADYNDHHWSDVIRNCHDAGTRNPYAKMISAFANRFGTGSSSNYERGRRLAKECLQALPSETKSRAYGAANWIMANYLQIENRSKEKEIYRKLALAHKYNPKGKIPRLPLPFEGIISLPSLEKFNQS